MKKHVSRLLLIMLIGICNTSCENSPKSQRGKGVVINWTDNLTNDFSFANEWSYDENIETNNFGQLVCYGLCNPDLENMTDDAGKIYEDSIVRYYQLIDTTHYNHSLKSEAKCYEWAGTNYIIARREGSDSVKCFTMCNTATHSSLELIISGEECNAEIVLNSVTPTGLRNYKCKTGNITIDKAEWEKGKIKAEFDFMFNDPENKKEEMWWRGKIYTNIEEKKVSAV